MPSPFPGMDPYLEGSLWTTVHSNLIEEIGRQLAPKLRPKYLVRTVRRFVLDWPEELVITTQGRYPDVGIISTHEPALAYGAETAVAPPLPLQIPTLMSERVPITSLEIRDTDTKELVTAIELLSPANKRGRGYEEYIEKREGLLHSRAHLLEIDLLRQGQRVPMQRPLPPAPYFIFLSRTEKRPMTDVWPLQLDKPLPTIPVPLLPGDSDITFNLQSALTTIYDLYSYDLSIDYTQPPKPALADETARWAAQLLQKAGFVHPS